MRKIIFGRHLGSKMEPRSDYTVRQSSFHLQALFLQSSSTTKVWNKHNDVTQTEPALELRYFRENMPKSFSCLKVILRTCNIQVLHFSALSKQPSPPPCMFQQQQLLSNLHGDVCKERSLKKIYDGCMLKDQVNPQIDLLNRRGP